MFVNFEKGRPPMCAAIAPPMFVSFDANDAILLCRLARYGKPFDVSRIYAWAQTDDALFEAIRFLQVRPRKRDKRYLNQTSIANIRRWCRKIAGTNIGGFTLHPHDGWWQVSPYPTRSLSPNRE